MCLTGIPVDSTWQRYLYTGMYVAAQAGRERSWHSRAVPGTRWLKIVVPLKSESWQIFVHVHKIIGGLVPPREKRPAT